MIAGVNVLIQQLSLQLSQHKQSGFIPVLVHLQSEQTWWVKRPANGQLNPKSLQLCYLRNSQCIPIGHAVLQNEVDGISTFSPTDWNPGSLSQGDWALWPSTKL